MKQITQRLRDGRIDVIDIPPPALTADGVLVDVRASLLSAGTERTKIQTGKQSLIGKARSRPDQVRQVVDKARRDGLRDTVRAVRTRLDQPSALGYSCAGVVLAVGDRVRDLVPGDRVACARRRLRGARRDRARAANLCAPLPDGAGLRAGRVRHRRAASRCRACARPTPAWASGWGDRPGPGGPADRPDPAGRGLLGGRRRPRRGAGAPGAHRRRRRPRVHARSARRRRPAPGGRRLRRGGHHRRGAFARSRRAGRPHVPRPRPGRGGRAT